jgi:hypothetical protein
MRVFLRGGLGDPGERMVCHRLEVEYPMPPSPGVRPDLATRLRQSQRALESRLGKPDAALSLMREAHASLDPGEIGELVVDRALEWLKATHAAVIASDHDGQIVPLAGRGLSDGLSVAARDVAQWVIAHGREFGAADLSRDTRVTGECGAVLALPLRARGRTIGALVILERTSASEDP